MKSLTVSLVILLLLFQSSNAQTGEAQDFIGTYSASVDPTTEIIIRKENTLTLEIAAQGKVSLSQTSKDKFNVNRVKPKAVIEFRRDESGKITSFKWNQPLPKFSFIRIRDNKPVSHEALSKYVGNYRLSNNPSKVTRIRIEKDHLTAQFVNEGRLPLKQVSENHFVLEDGDLKLSFDFIPDQAGEITSLNFLRTGSPEFKKISDDTGMEKYGFDHRNKFTRADSLRGQLTSPRSCYDVLFYDLNVSVDPSTRSINGSNTIRFKATSTFNRLQVDLFANMKIEKIIHQHTPLPFDREYNAVFVDFPEAVHKGTIAEITITYSGKPQTPDGPKLAGGIFWLWNKEGEYWVETVTQGSGASLWWPCKDHLSDKPDSMKISVTVPRGLTDISNGRLLRKVELPEDKTRFDWYVSYPITTYCVALNIGNYKHFSATYISDRDTLPLNFYCMTTDTTVARKFFKQAKPMLAVFEKSFGKYPFPRDGFTLLQSVYPMEHQSAISIGAIFDPFNSERYDSVDVLQTLWHESAHEWWGNNVTAKDMADLWIHEAFATYGEVLAYEQLIGKEAAKKYLRKQTPGNKEPIIGKHDVNDFHLGDMYPKGALLLHTLRSTIANDSVWFDLLRGIQTHFAFQSITTNDFVHYINEKIKTDFTDFFDQYLTKTSIPKLELRFKNTGNVTHVQYRWKTDTEKFNMRIKATVARDIFSFIYPTKDWNELALPNMKPKDFKVDTENFYVAILHEK